MSGCYYEVHKAIAVCWCKQPTSNNFQTRLYWIFFKLYIKSIIILLANDLNNILGEKSKTRLILYLQCERAGGIWNIG